MALLYSSSSSLSSLSEIVVSPYSTQIVTTNVVAPLVPVFNYEIDTGLNSNYLVQKDTTREILYLTLDKWLYSSEMSHLLKYLTLVGGKVVPIAKEDDYKTNKISGESDSVIEQKIDYIQENLLDMDQMRKILTKITEELDYKWYDLLSHKKVVMEVIERHLKKKLKRLIGQKN
jgi:hypothetical protein